MSINLVKGQNVNLSKECGTSIGNLQVGLGWNMPGVASALAEKKGGFLGRLTGAARAVGNAATGRDTMDLDSSIFLFDNAGQKLETIYFGNKRSSNGSILHHGDDLVGGGNAKDPNEIIDVNLNSLPANVAKAVVTVNIFGSTGDNFGQLENAFVTVRDKNNGNELVNYELNGKEMGSSRTCYVAEFYRHNGDWKFKAIGVTSNETSLGNMAFNY